MAMIFVHDYSAKGRERRFALWAIPCPKNISQEEIQKRITRAVRNCYQGLVFYGQHDRLLSAKQVAEAVVGYAFQKGMKFWEFQSRPDYYAVVPFKLSMERITHGLEDVEREVLKINKWTRG